MLVNRGGAGAHTHRACPAPHWEGGVCLLLLQLHPRRASFFVVCTHTLGATLLDVTRKPRYKPDRLRARSAGRGMQIRESSNGRQWRRQRLRGLPRARQAEYCKPTTPPSSNPAPPGPASPRPMPATVVPAFCPLSTSAPPGEAARGLNRPARSTRPPRCSRPVCSASLGKAARALDRRALDPTAAPLVCCFPQPPGCSLAVLAVVPACLPWALGGSPCSLRPHLSPTWWRWVLRSILQLHLDRALKASAGSGVQRSQRHCPKASRALRRCRSLASSAETEVVLEAERHSLGGHAPARARTPHNPHGLARRAPVGRASSRRLRLRDVTGARSACTTTVPPARLVGSLC